MTELISERYEVLGKLGSGVLGEVVKVRDTTSGAVRAMKLFKPTVVSASSMGRFEREFRAISRIRHPNIVEVLDFGVHGGRPYFTMELLDGSDLRVYVQESRPAAGGPAFEEYVRRVAYVFHQVSEALDVVHQAGVVHRDLKPENIFVRPGKFPRAKLLDFGHARDEDQQNLTATGTVLGTSWYIPPEQCMGRKAGPAADLYSLGCVLYEALTGRPPFAGGTVMEIILAHIQREAPAAHAIDPRVPAEISELCAALMRKDPTERPATAAEVAATLARV